MKDFLIKYWAVWVIYLLLINVLAFALYGIDKRKAVAGKDKKTGRSAKRRIPEAELLGVSLAGGGIGAYIAMFVFRHKTKRIKFLVGVPICFLLDVLLIILLSRI